MPQWCRSWIRLCLVLVGTGAAVAAASDASAEAPAPFIIRAWDTDEGLPQNSVTAIVQSRRGYLWLGTQNGLVRFNGSRFEVFDESNTPGLPSSRIVSLFEDAAGTLWVGTETGGVVLIRDGEATATGLGQGASESRLVATAQDASGSVWLNTADGAVWQHREGRFTPYLFAHDRPSSLRSIVATSDGEVWIATDSQLARVGDQAALPLELPLTDEMRVGRLDFILPHREGGLWRLADGRIQWWRSGALQRDYGPYPWAGTARVAAACEDGRGQLVVGTLGAGLFWLGADGQVARLTARDGLSQNSVIAVCADREGNLWAGTQGGGLNRVKPQVFEVVPTTRGLTVLSVCEDVTGGVWVGTDGDGVIHRGAGRTERFSGAEGLINPQVLSLATEGLSLGAANLLANPLQESEDGPRPEIKVWAGTRASGLFELQGGQFEPAVGSEGLHAIVSVLYRDRRGRLWCGTPSGLGLREAPGWRLFTTREGMSANEVRAIAESSDGDLWIGTVGGGVNRLRDGKFVAFRKADGLPSDDVSSLLVDDEGDLWVGTFGGGLARREAGQWIRFTTREGLPSNSIGAMLDDGQGSVWIGSNAGLSRLAKGAFSRAPRLAPGRLAIRVYDRVDGLPTRECPIGSQPAAWRGADGRLWFATVRGLASVQPARLRLNLTPPPVMIEDVIVDGVTQVTNLLLRSIPERLILPPDRQRLEIQYASLNLGAPDRARFRYRLEGFETEWAEAGSTREARYSRLPPGRYRFRVIASNEDGVWNETGSTLAIEVLTPLWKERWFVATAAATLLVFSGALVRVISTQRLKRQVAEMKREEALEKERARIAQDLHDQLGANLTQVALLGELTETDKDLPDEVEAHARQIAHTARETTRTLDEIVWAVNPSNDTIEGLVTYLCKHTQEYLAVAGIRYRLDAPTELPQVPIPPELRHNVFLAAKEAVTNVVRHAAATAVSLRLRIGEGTLTVEIEDDGKGLGTLDEKAVRNRNGLRGMRTRMDNVGGLFEIAPAPAGKGTRVRLTVPLHPPAGAI